MPFTKKFPNAGETIHIRVPKSYKEGVIKLCQALDTKFRKDVVIDMWCYRRFGHNEGDEPAFTQPKMYRTIAIHPTVREIYANQLIAEGVITPEQVKEIQSNVRTRLDRDFEAKRSEPKNLVLWLLL